MNLLRTLLFTPGNNERMIQKVINLPTDAIIFDLEDSVPMADKETARQLVCDSLQTAAQNDTCILVRVNAPDTGLFDDDLDSVVQPGLSGIVLPKAECAKDIKVLSAKLDQLEKDRNLEPSSVCIVPILETAKGVIHAYDVASACPRIAAVAFGGVDFSRDMGITLTKEGDELAYPRAQIAVCAKAAGVLAIDTPCIDVRNIEQLNVEANTAKQLGFTGKLLIHPAQIGPVNEVFSPTEAQAEYAQKIIAAFEQAQTQGLGAISLEGKMIDVANYRQAKDLLASYEAICRRRESLS